MYSFFLGMGKDKILVYQLLLYCYEKIQCLKQLIVYYDITYYYRRYHIQNFHIWENGCRKVGMCRSSVCELISDPQDLNREYSTGMKQDFVTSTFMFKCHTSSFLIREHCQWISSIRGHFIGVITEKRTSINNVEDENNKFL